MILNLKQRVSTHGLPKVKTTHCHFLSPSLSDHILCSVTWATDERVAVQWVTRKHNYVIVQIYDFDGNSWKEKQVAVKYLCSQEILTVR